MTSPYVSVTQVLKAHHFYDDLDKAGEANQIVGKERGSALHKAAHWLALGQEPPWREPHPELDRYLIGVRYFLRHHFVKLIMHEDEWINPFERLVAHPDWHCEIDGVEAVIEIKTGALPRWVGLQLAGQLIARGTYPPLKRFALSLPGDQSYKLVPQTDRHDFDEFRILLRAYHVRAKYMEIGE